MRPVSLAIGGVVVDAFGIEPLYWSGGALLTLAGLLGLLLLGSYNFRATDVASGATSAR